MNKKFLEFFRCPLCKSSLKCNSSDTNGDDILKGRLICESKHVFEIQQGVPNFIVNREECKNNVDFQEPDSVESFGFEWQWDNIPRTEDDLHFRVFEKPNITKDFLNAKLVLDAGCGAGLQTNFMARHGALVIGIDLSDAVKAACKNNSNNENVCIAKSDILNAPFKNETFDYIYCEGVLQHVKDPKEAFYKLVSLLKEKGQIFATFYTKREGKITPFLLLREPIRFVLSKLSKKLCWYICWLSVPLNKIPLLKYFFRKTIVLYDKRNPSDKSTWCLNYDFYGPHKYQYYFKPSEIVDIWENSGDILTILHSEKGYPLRGEKEQQHGFSNYERV